MNVTFGFALILRANFDKTLVVIRPNALFVGTFMWAAHGHHHDKNCSRKNSIAHNFAGSQPQSPDSWTDYDVLASRMVIKILIIIIYNVYCLLR